GTRLLDGTRCPDTPCSMARLPSIPARRSKAMVAGIFSVHPFLSATVWIVAHLSPESTRSGNNPPILDACSPMHAHPCLIAAWHLNSWNLAMVEKEWLTPKI